MDLRVVGLDHASVALSFAFLQAGAIRVHFLVILFRDSFTNGVQQYSTVSKLLLMKLSHGTFLDGWGDLNFDSFIDVGAFLDGWGGI
jgi:hypothetical protein